MRGGFFSKVQKAWPGKKVLDVFLIKKSPFWEVFQDFIFIRNVLELLEMYLIKLVLFILH